MRVYVAYGGHSVELRPGETIIGRDVGCQIRFNDPQVSRAHLRIFVHRDGVELQDAGSRNGTRVNGNRARTRLRLENGDRIELGTREIVVQIEDSRTASFEEETDVPAGVPSVSAETPQPAAAPPKPRHACPACGQSVDKDDDACAHCGYCWGDFRPALLTAPHKRVTQDLPAVRKRRHPRFRVDLPIIYQSESLEIEAIALDLSRGGVFVQTQVLEPVDTACTITMLLDGAPVMAVTGRVVRTVERGDSGSAPGLGVEFSEQSPGVEAFLNRMLARYAPSDS